MKIIFFLVGVFLEGCLEFDKESINKKRIIMINGLCTEKKKKILDVFELGGSEPFLPNKKKSVFRNKKN